MDIRSGEFVPGGLMRTHRRDDMADLYLVGSMSPNKVANPAVSLEELQRGIGYKQNVQGGNGMDSVLVQNLSGEKLAPAAEDVEKTRVGVVPKIGERSGGADEDDDAGTASGDASEDEDEEGAPATLTEAEVHECKWSGCTAIFNSCEELVAHCSEGHIGDHRFTYDSRNPVVQQDAYPTHLMHADDGFGSGDGGAQHPRWRHLGLEGMHMKYGDGGMRVGTEGGRATPPMGLAMGNPYEGEEWGAGMGSQAFHQ
ncbi:hypothetical protein HK097_009409 [Rhizophlyctis rosea]|uniref:C2H2-type domain-containing protein n=1 Tax=Rhizophlyctis rosea TaxID=64517 RepID=A0AAD5SHU8_9FUNG|nr:hypothetical protein HK097_009409 [Rhizophlyctis rosea]